MARLFLDERNLREAGLSPQNILTIREITAFLNLQAQVTAAEADIAAAQEAIEDANLSLTSLDGRIDTLETANLDSRLSAAEGDITALESGALLPITVDATGVKDIVFAGAGVSVSIVGDTATVTIA